MKKEFKMPSALTIVFCFLLIVVALTWIVPTSVAIDNADGTSTVIYNAAFDADGNVIEDAGTAPMGLWDLLLAPVRSFGDAASVGVTILVSGGFLQILTYVGALDAGIGRLVKKFKGKTLIAILTLTFALMGTIYGSWEELPAYALVIIPLFVRAGYDVMTGICVIFVGALAGNIASVVNPFSTGAAIASIGNPELSLGSGIAMRAIIFVVLYIFSTIMLISYAERVKADSKNSVVANIPDINTLINADVTEMPEFTGRRKVSIVIFAVMILLTVMGYVPWYAIHVGSQTMYEIINYPFVFFGNLPVIGDLLGSLHVTWFGDWYFDEFSVVFILGAILVAFVNRMSEAEFVREFVKGCQDLLGMVLVLSVARGIALVMGTRTEGMSVTFVYWIQNAIVGVPAWAFAIAVVAAFCLIGIFLQTTSGVAGITMPIMGAVAVALFSSSPVGAVGGQLMLVSAFTLGLNFIGGIYPSATTMGVIDLVNVPYPTYVKMMLRFMIPFLIITTFIISVAPYIGLI